MFGPDPLPIDRCGRGDKSLMKFGPWYLVALTPFAMLGSGAFVGQVLVLIVTLGIFFGTLSLGAGQQRTSSRPVDPTTIQSS